MDESSAVSQLRARVDELERRIGRLEEAILLGIGGSSSSGGTQPSTGGQPVSDRYDRVRQAIRAGKKIEAIKEYREIEGVGLREAKDAVEAMERSLRA